ncbi:glycine cleavage system protein R [Synechococcus sp. PCC 7336]|uniref:glycine cleavage system protein R n=1 Tax=Synechococcus sp. PCC 7336 TaxID=195250 RepID=UPI0003481B1C|nr:ACT domain-containing protein [Synechococcus sp. PCC 7336]
MSRFLISGFGRDRPGMVATVSKLLLDLGANLEDTSMTRLGGQFAMLMLLSDGDVPLSVEAIRAAIAARQGEFDAAGLHLLVSEIEDEEEEESATEPRYLIRVSGADRPGIVYGVTQFLADRGVNIVDVSSRRLQGSSRAVYLLLIEGVLPGGYAADRLERELSELQAQLGLEIQTEPVDVMTL